MVSLGSGPPAHSASLEPAAYRMDRALTTEHPPVAGVLRDLPPAPQPSGEARRRSERRFQTSPWSHPAPRRFCDGSSRLGHGSVTALSRLVTARHGSVTVPSRLCHGSSRLVTALSRLRACKLRIRLINVTKASRCHPRPLSTGDGRKGGPAATGTSTRPLTRSPFVSIVGALRTEREAGR